MTFRTTEPQSLCGIRKRVCKGERKRSIRYLGPHRGGDSRAADDEKAEYLETLGLKESGLDKLIRASYDLLGLMSFPDGRREGDQGLDHKEGHHCSSGSRKDTF